MSTECVRCFNSSCPEMVPTVNISQTTLSLADEDVVVGQYIIRGFSGTALTIPYEVYEAFGVQVFVGGELFVDGKDYTRVGENVSLVNTVSSQDIVIRYASTNPLAAAAPASSDGVHRYIGYPASGSTIDLGETPGADFPVVVFINGVLQEEGVANDYTISGSVVTFVSVTFDGSDLVQILYSIA